MKSPLTLFLIALLYLSSFQCHGDSRIYIITNPDRSKIYVDGIFRGTYSSYHDQALEILISPGKHVIEAVKVGDDPVLSYQKKDISIDTEEWRTVRLELRRHPESDHIDRSNISEEDFVTTPLPKGYSRRSMRNPSLSKTARESKKKIQIKLLKLDISKTKKHVLALDIKGPALGYLALKRSKEAASKQSRLAYLHATPPPGMVAIPSGLFCDIMKPDCESVEIEPFLIAEKEVTIKQWQDCMQADICSRLPSAVKAKNLQQAVNGVSFNDTRQYLKWLKKSVGVTARLPTDDEWRLRPMQIQAQEFHGEMHRPKRMQDVQTISHLLKYRLLLVMLGCTRLMPLVYTMLLGMSRR
ncbi:MAG: SUMF1/EgtB/PvdO family nonheme iron enzyme [Candidatus Thiodiazotropha sp. (ex Rostrolucina anterorostrata)]|nr:SUMF1/EgtB/PvdO family nonheme iron enzyme [Candidatus Thiodiazotropha sp. (ex Rostrolucina anterorostrata)]